MSKKIQFELKDALLNKLGELAQEKESLNQVAKRLLSNLLEGNQPIPDTEDDRQHIGSLQVGELIARIESLESQVNRLPSPTLVEAAIQKASFLMDGGCIVRNDLKRTETELRHGIESLSSRVDSTIKETLKEIKRVNRCLKKLQVEPIEYADSQPDSQPDSQAEEDYPILEAIKQVRIIGNGVIKPNSASADIPTESSIESLAEPIPQTDSLLDRSSNEESSDLLETAPEPSASKVLESLPSYLAQPNAADAIAPFNSPENADLIDSAAAVKVYVETIDAFDGKWWNAETDNPVPGEVWLYCTQNMRVPAIVDVTFCAKDDSDQSLYGWKNRGSQSHGNCTRQSLHIRLLPNPSKPSSEALSAKVTVSQELPESAPEEALIIIDDGVIPPDLTSTYDSNPYSILLIARGDNGMKQGEIKVWGAGKFSSDISQGKIYRSKRGTATLIKEQYQHYPSTQYYICLINAEWLQSKAVSSPARYILEPSLLKHIVLICR